MILVTGATGKTGSRVLRRLCDRGLATRGLVRDASRASDLPEGAEIAVAAYEDPVALDAAVSGCGSVYLVSPAGPDQRSQEGAVIEAVRRSATGAHVVKLAALGLGDPDGGRITAQHGLIRDDLRASGLPWTVLAISQLMHNLYLYAGPVLEQGLLPVPAGDARVAWVDAEDVAAVAVEVLTNPGHVGRTYAVTGPEALHHDQVAALLAQRVQRPVRYVDVSPESAAVSMIAAGVPPWIAQGVVETNRFYRHGGALAVTPVVKRLTGRAPTTMRQFLQSNPDPWVAHAAATAPVPPSPEPSGSECR